MSSKKLIDDLADYAQHMPFTAVSLAYNAGKRDGWNEARKTFLKVKNRFFARRIANPYEEEE